MNITSSGIELSISEKIADGLKKCVKKLDGGLIFLGASAIGCASVAYAVGAPIIPIVKPFLAATVLYKAVPALWRVADDFVNGLINKKALDEL